MKIKTFFIASMILCMAPELAFAQQSAVTLLQTSLSSSLDLIFNDLQGMAIKWLGLFMLLQMVWTNLGLLASGPDLEKVWAKFLGGLFWSAMCLYIFENGADFIKNISTFFLQKATGYAGIGFDPTAPITAGLNVASSLLAGLNGAQGILQSFNPFPSMMMGVVSVVILAVSAVIAFKVLMIFIETKIVIALSPLSFALLGVNALKDQGFAPLKYLISMAYRMIILGAILAAMISFSAALVAEFKTLPAASDPSFWPPVWAAAIGYALLGALAWKADSIAAMLSSGSSQMSTGDAAAVGAVAGAAAAAVVTGGAAIGGGAASAASGGGNTIGNMLKNMAGGSGGGSAKNESGSGRGGEYHPGPAPQKPAMSFGEKMASGPNPPKESDFPGYQTAAQPSSRNDDSSQSKGGNSGTSSSGSGSGAGIGGGSESGNKLEEKIDKLADAMGQNSGSKQPSFGDRVKELNDHAQREGGAVQVSMNTHSEL